MHLVLMGERLPPRLMALPDPPEALYVRGELPRGPAVAIVGTRKPTPKGEAFARRLASALAKAGVAILSGGAKGIDRAAHEGALDANGCTVVVAPAGFDAPFPTEHRALFQRVISVGGAYLSLVPEDRPATQSAFFARNRCLVALAHAVVVVQAPVRSGARNAAAHARRLGRPLFVVPWFPGVYQGRGCLAELRRGAHLCEGVRDVLTSLHELGAVAVAPLRRGRCAGPDPAQKAFDFGHMPEPDRDAARVIEAARSGITEADRLCDELELPAARIQRALLTLRLLGVLVPGPNGSLILSNSSY